MNDDQRGAMFESWANKSKSIEIEIKELEDGSGWEAKPKTDIGVVIHYWRDTKAAVISAIHDSLTRRGYRISNLAEVQGIN